MIMMIGDQVIRGWNPKIVSCMDSFFLLLLAAL